MSKFPNPKDYATTNEWSDAYDEYIAEADVEHDRLKAEDPEHPQTCCSEDCPTCDSLGLEGTPLHD